VPFTVKHPLQSGLPLEQAFSPDLMRRSPGSGLQLPDPSFSSMLPELLGAMVPPNRKFTMNVPSLYHISSDQAEVSRQLQVLSIHPYVARQVPMFQISFLRYKPTNGLDEIEESFSVSLPGEVDKELVACTFGRPRGPQLQCEIHKSGAGENVRGALFGIMHEEGSSGREPHGTTSYTMFLPSGKRLLTVVVTGPLTDRNIKIVDAGMPSKELAVTVGCSGDSSYQVECYPNTDVALAVIALTAADRLAAGQEEAVERI